MRARGVKDGRPAPVPLRPVTAPGTRPGPTHCPGIRPRSARREGERRTMTFTETRALITGADSGIGQATAELFAREGADVAITYHTDEAGIRETAARVEAAGRRALVLQLDVGDPAAVNAAFDRIGSEFGTLDILVANAGQAMSGMPVAAMDDALLERILRVNLMGPLFCARPFIRMRKAQGGNGKIVFVSSVAQHLPTPESAPYGMSKAGLGPFAGPCRGNSPRTGSTSTASPRA
jgi:glucose 1-dehydrogenase